jgi:hypothetical protein
MLALLSANFLFMQKVLPHKYRPLPIVSHLLGCVILIPIVFMVVQHVYHTSVPTIYSDIFLKHTQNLLGALVLGFILLELSHIKPSKKILKVSIFSCIIPIVGALGICILLGLLSNVKLTVALMCVFSISAVPVLYLYLKQLNVDDETMNLLMGVAIFIDMLAWLAFGFISSSFSLISLVGCLALGFSPLLIKNILKNLTQDKQKIIFAFLFFSVFLILYVIKSYALVFAIVYLINLQKLNINIENFIPTNFLQIFFNYIAIPLLFIFATLSISWGNILNEIKWAEFSLLLTAPIVLKIVGSWIGLKFVGWKEKSLFGALLLNIRGLTEIVFLNILLSSDIVDATQYLALLLMSLIATITPGILRKFVKNAN